MRHFLAALVLLPAACGPPDIHDLRLDRVLPPGAVAVAGPPGRGRAPAGPQVASQIGIVAEFSTTTDLRRYVQHHGDGGDGTLFTCAGSGEGREDLRLIQHEGLRDAAGKLDDPGLPVDPPGTAGRRVYHLPIHLSTRLSELRLNVDGPLLFRYPAYDLRRDIGDLCFYLTDGYVFEGPWRTNTVVIPRRAIDVALGQAPP